MAAHRAQTHRQGLNNAGRVASLLHSSHKSHPYRSTCINTHTHSSLRNTSARLSRRRSATESERGGSSSRRLHKALSFICDGEKSRHTFLYFSISIHFTSDERDGTSDSLEQAGIYMYTCIYGLSMESIGRGGGGVGGFEAIAWHHTLRSGGNWSYT